MKALSIVQLLHAVDGKLLFGEPEGAVSSVSTDSRTVGTDALFVALAGESFDGHDYIEKALIAGAAGCLCNRAPEHFIDGKFYILVDDTRLALKALAAWYRSQFTIPVIQITGSTGKTTAKEMIWSVLKEKFSTLKTQANYNNDIGTPMTLLELDDSHEAAVIETGMDHLGEIRYLGEMVRPQYAAIINVGVAHIEFLGSRENILKAKCEILENLAPDGIVYLNGDDEMLNTVQGIAQRIVRFGKGENCDVRVSEIETKGLHETSCHIKTARRSYDLAIPAPGEHMIYPAALAVALGEELGMTREEITKGIAAYTPVGARMRVRRLGGERILLDDCYNANPQSMEASLRVLHNASGTKRIAVLGNMGELGDFSEQAHQDLGTLCAQLEIDSLFAVGPLARLVAQAAEEQGMKDVHAYREKEEAYEEIAKAYESGAVLLLKASLYTGRFEFIAAYLEEKFGIET